METHCRFLSQALRTADGWKVRTFDCIYLKDRLQTVNPEQRLPIDWGPVPTLRPSYRFLSWLLSLSGYRIDQNLAGVDRPDLIEALYVEADAWLTPAA